MHSDAKRSDRYLLPSAGSAARRFFAVLALGATAGVAGFGLFAATSDQSLRAQFETAFDRLPKAASPNGGIASAATMMPVAGTEEYWLGGSTAPGASLASWSGGPVAIGDRISIAGKGGTRVLEVFEVTTLASGVLPVSHGTSQPMALVSARQVDGGADGRIVRFLVETGSDQPVAGANVASGVPARAL